MYFRSTTSPKLTKERLLKLYRTPQLLTGMWSSDWKSIIGTLQSWGSTRTTVVEQYPLHCDWRTGLKKGTALCRAAGLEHNPDMHYIPGKVNGYFCYTTQTAGKCFHLCVTRIVHDHFRGSRLTYYAGTHCMHEILKPSSKFTDIH